MTASTWWAHYTRRDNWRRTYSPTLSRDFSDRKRYLTPPCRALLVIEPRCTAIVLYEGKP